MKYLLILLFYLVAIIGIVTILMFSAQKQVNHGCIITTITEDSILSARKVSYPCSQVLIDTIRAKRIILTNN